MLLKLLFWAIQAMLYKERVNQIKREKGGGDVDR